MIRRYFLVVKADGSARVLQRASHLESDEVAFKVVVEFPEGWARIAEQELHITMPEPPEAAVVVP